VLLASYAIARAERQRLRDMTHATRGVPDDSTTRG
jgi:hypothetical protein